MSTGTARLLMIVFAVVGTLAALLGLGVVGMVLLFYRPGEPNLHGDAIVGSLLYLGIGAACFYAVFRLRRAKAPAATSRSE